MTIARLTRFTCLLPLFAVVAAAPALAQEVRNYSGSTAVRGETDYDRWLNYDEASCLDRGLPTITMVSAPRLGRVVLRKTQVRSDSGACAGKPLSVVIVHYIAGSVPGTDTFRYTVQGSQLVTVNASLTVQ